MSGSASSLSEVRVEAHSFGQSNGLINTLSPEVLTEIFLNATYVDYPRAWFSFLPHRDRDPFSFNLPDLCTSSAPLKLCHVCSRWRRIALNASVLWSRFSLSHFHTRNAKIKAKIWIANSGQLPLTFLVHATRNMSLDLNNEREFRAWRYILRLLSSHAHRWQHVSIKLLDIRLSSIAVASFTKTSPLLETVCLETHEDSQNLQLPQQLKRLELGSRMVHPALLLPLKKLEYLQLSSIDGPSLLLVVQQNPYLRTLDARIALIATPYITSESPPPEYIVRHTNTFGMHLRGDGDGIAFVLNSLALPQLDSVGLTTCSCEALHCLMHLLVRSRTDTGFPPVHTLVLSPPDQSAHIPFTTDMMKCLLTYMPHLKDLSIFRSAPLNNSLLRAFTHGDESNDVLCPELEHLDWESDAKCSKRILAAMLSSRWQQIPLRLTRITVITLSFSQAQLLAEPILSGGIPNGVLLEI